MMQTLGLAAAALALAACAHAAGPGVHASRQGAARPEQFPASSGALVEGERRCAASHQKLKIESVDAGHGTMMIDCAPLP